MTRYEHTQIGHVIIWSLLAIILTASSELIGHRAPPVIVSILLLCFVLFYKLSITIDDATLAASFGLSIIRKKVRLAEIVGCEPIRIRWWYGWGIHLTPCGWLYNVSGFDAVAITLRNGKKMALGTDDPHGLGDAIRTAIFRGVPRVTHACRVWQERRRDHGLRWCVFGPCDHES